MARSGKSARCRRSAFSPHTRGWPGLRRPRHRQAAEFSPHTRGWPGCHRSDWLQRSEFSPHTRGWPGQAWIGHGCSQSSPRTRGDGPAYESPQLCHRHVLPAHAGMARVTPPPPAAGPRSPRTRGDGPAGTQISELIAEFSPHTRGWPDGNGNAADLTSVLPAHAGMARWCPARRGRC